MADFAEEDVVSEFELDEGAEAEGLGGADAGAVAGKLFDCDIRGRCVGLVSEDGEAGGEGCGQTGRLTSFHTLLSTAGGQT